MVPKSCLLYTSVAEVEAYAGEAPEGSCVVGGSSSVSPLMEKLIEAYAEVNPNASIELQTSDSTTGMTSAIEGSYDIGMASRELKDEEADVYKRQVLQCFISWRNIMYAITRFRRSRLKKA